VFPTSRKMIFFLNEQSIHI